LGVSNKIEIFDEYVKKYKLKYEEIVYMGDDIPDFEILQQVGVSCCPADAAEEILETVDYISHNNPEVKVQ
jgi:3-deoxy-D-manno-octulosonate 8-phosphate phosphatase (KDO 8-P phosphatase)